ncbi:hypothetical protein HGM15179_018651, partial [Zosterops borbonicus]
TDQLYTATNASFRRMKLPWTSFRIPKSCSIMDLTQGADPLSWFGKTGLKNDSPTSGPNLTYNIKDPCWDPNKTADPSVGGSTPSGNMDLINSSPQVFGYLHLDKKQKVSSLYAGMQGDSHTFWFGQFRCYKENKT